MSVNSFEIKKHWISTFDVARFILSGMGCNILSYLYTMDDPFSLHLEINVFKYIIYFRINRKYFTAKTNSSCCFYRKKVSITNIYWQYNYPTLFVNIFYTR